MTFTHRNMCAILVTLLQLFMRLRVCMILMLWTINAAVVAVVGVVVVVFVVVVVVEY